MPSCAATLKELGGALERQFQLPADLARGAVLPPGIACEPMPAQRSTRTGLLELHLCRNATHGLLVAEYSNATERVALLRMGGPHPQTAIFQRSAAGQPPAGTRPRWVAPFRTCTPGTYTVHVLFVTLDPWGQGQMGFMRQCNIHHTPEAVLMRNASAFKRASSAFPDERLFLNLRNGEVSGDASDSAESAASPSGGPSSIPCPIACASFSTYDARRMPKNRR